MNSADPNKNAKLTLKLFLWGYRFVIGFALVNIILLNLQPWAEVGGWFADAIVTIPFLSALVKIPFLGGVINWSVSNIAYIITVIVWALIQFIQILNLCTMDPTVESWIRLVFGLSVPKTSETINKLRKLSGYAYLLEAFVCLLRYNLYGSGVGDIISDFGNWDPYLFNYGQMAMFFLTLLLFEGFIWLIAFLTMSVLTKRTA